MCTLQARVSEVSMGADRGLGLGLGLGSGLAAYSRRRTDVAAGSMRPSSVAPVTPMPEPRRSHPSMASSSRSRSKGTPPPSQTPR